jgi:hypothetical protein
MANKTEIQQFKNTQMMTTIPKGIWEARVRHLSLAAFFDNGDVIVQKC